MDQMHDPRKRKHPPAPVGHRPSKQMKPEAHPIDSMDADDLPPNGSVESDMVDDESDVDPGHLLSLAPIAADSAEWQATIENVVQNVVSIRFCQTCSFDTESAVSSEATGFVVDSERGYILTNRHVVGAGPFWGYCIFDNHEECDVYPVYRDPVHDFGILRFDPKAIKYMPLSALALRPDLARVGVEIRVVGNDAGEKLSILSGVISRLDRNAPEYGEGYSDFSTPCHARVLNPPWMTLTETDTNYIQAAAAASGGSSGSPVVNMDGHAIALQAGGRSDGAATDYFLPLDRPLRALQCIQRGEAVSRGTIQCQWMIKPFDECRRLGLTPHWEKAIRESFPKETGMLVAEIVLPEGPADEKVEEGDVLIKVNGKLLTQFVHLDAILDDSVGQKLRLTVQRGGQDLDVELDVGDLHAITPDRFVTVAGAAFHNLSYQQARLYAVAVKGVFVCEAAGSFKFDGTEQGWIIQSVNQQDTPDLDTFVEVMKAIPDRERVVATYKHLRDLHTLNTSILYIDRHWTSRMKLAVRNDVSGKWDFTTLAEALPPNAPVPRKANFIRLDSLNIPAAADVVRSFVRITCSMHVKLDGFPWTNKIGFGLVVDAAKGLVVVSRAIVPYDMCDIFVTVADSIVVDGKVLFMHPLENYAIIQYDPSLVQAPVQSATLSEEAIKQGASTIFLGFNQNLRVVVAKTTVTDITTVTIPANTAAPRYHAINLDAITVDTNLSSQCGSGVLVAEDGTVQALWLCYLGERTSGNNKDIEYHIGMATPSLVPIVRQIQRGDVPNLRIINVEFNTAQMSQVRIMGVSEEWIQRVEAENPERHQLFMVRKVECGHPQTLQEGDVLLTLNGKLMTRVSELDIMYDHDELDAVIVRKSQEMHIKVPTVPTEDLETDRAVIFCGAVLHAPHHAVRQQSSKMHSEIYVSARTRGSPSYQYGLAPTNFITAVNGTQTPDLGSFLEQVNKIPDNTYFRLKAVTFDNVPWVVTMKKNEHYFPTMEFIKDPSEPTGWKRLTYENGTAAEGIGALAAEAMDEGGALEAAADSDYKDDGTNILLDANENAYGPSLDLDSHGRLKRESTNGSANGEAHASPFDLSGLHRYPDPHQHDVKQLLCDLRNVDPHQGQLRPENVFVGVGSDEAIDSLLRCFCRPGVDKILTCPPTYGMYAVSAHVNDVEVVPLPLDPADFSLRPAAIKDALSQDAHIKLVYVTSPGNPTGSLISRAALRDILEHSTWNGLVVVDEAYVDFAPDGASLAQEVLEWPNLVVMQTLSKAFGMAGIRLGGVFTAAPIAALMNNVKAPYNIPAPTSALARIALSPANVAIMRQHRTKIMLQRDRLLDELPKIRGVGRFLGGRDSNFLLVEMLDAPGGRPSNEVALAVYQGLAASKGVVVRFRGMEYGCLGCLRITVGVEDEVTRFLREIRVVLESIYHDQWPARGDEAQEEREANDVVA
ncbi:MAG: hypothetical protein M1838_003219 [Thelocarpon superellum]|nr:MAG: hypothetical protein M1838_003219 [Thelocarpon superellum]